MTRSSFKIDPRHKRGHRRPIRTMMPFIYGAATGVFLAGVWGLIAPQFTAPPASQRVDLVPPLKP